MSRAPQVALQRHKAQAHITHQVVAVAVVQVLLATAVQAVQVATMEQAAAGVVPETAPAASSVVSAAQALPAS
jgi:hypothetical protein